MNNYKFMQKFYIKFQAPAVGLGGENAPALRRFIWSKLYLYWKLIEFFKKVWINLRRKIEFFQGLVNLVKKSKVFSKFTCDAQIDEFNQTLKMFGQNNEK